MSRLLGVFRATHVTALFRSSWLRRLHFKGLARNAIIRIRSVWFMDLSRLSYCDVSTSSRIAESLIFQYSCLCKSYGTKVSPDAIPK